MPDSQHTTVTKDGYEVTFHPAFSSRCSVQSHQEGAGEVELYKQQGVHHLPKGQTKPPARHEIVFKGGAHGRDISLSVHDPKYHIAKITVELYADGHQPGAATGDASIESFSVDNDSSCCPPICQPTGTDPTTSPTTTTP